MVPLRSLRIPRVRRYSGYCRLIYDFVYRTLTLFRRVSHRVRLSYQIPYTVLTPQILLSTVWPLSLSLATTREISVDFFSSAYLDVSVQQVPSTYLCIQYAVVEVCSTGFPHSDIRGSKLICSSPQLFAACHVLRRLPMPRHSPYALYSLNFRSSVLLCMSFANRLF